MNNKLRIRSYSMMSPVNTQGAAASWCYTIHYLAKSFIKNGHEVHLVTTNGVTGISKDLLKCFRDCPNPDIEYTYTTPNNFPYRFQGVSSNTKRAKMRCGILNYESSILPTDWIQYSQYVDYFLVSSSYCADIFLRAGIPPEKVIVMPLGIDFDSLNAPLDDFSFKTKKKFKLLNVSINHARKNIPQLIDAYLDEFSADDDICLVLKTTMAKPKDVFEIDLLAAFNELRIKYSHKKLPEIEVVEQRLNNMATLYKKCDALINVAASEGFGLPVLEGMACGMLVAAPRYGGVLDFVEHNKNGLLIDAIEIKAPKEYQYWQYHPGAAVGMPVNESVKATMRKMYENGNELKNTFRENMNEVVKRYTWDNSARVILDLYEGRKPKKAFGELI